MRHLPILFLALLPASGLASVVIGNPNMGVVLVDGDDVYVHSVIGYRCGGGSQTMSVDTTLDELDEAPIEFDEDDFCDVVVRLKWTSSSSLESIEVTGFTTLEIDASGAGRTIDVDKSAQTATLN